MKKFAFAFVSVAVLALVSSVAFAHGVKDLPKGVKGSPRVTPGMGQHFSDPKLRPHGPVYGMMDGKIVFYESEVMLGDMKGSEEWERVLTFANHHPRIDHLDIKYLPKGHRNMEVPHVVIHMYTVPHEVHMKYKRKPGKKK